MVLRMECGEKDTSAVYGKVIDRENIKTPKEAPLLTVPSTYTHQKITTGPVEIAQQLELTALAEDQDLIPNTHVAALNHA